MNLQVRTASLSEQVPSFFQQTFQASVSSSLRRSIETRLRLLAEFNSNPSLQRLEIELCRRDPTRLFDRWAWTYNPKEAAKGRPTFLPFDLFPRQREMLHFLNERLAAGEDGLIEKSRDIGFTWVAGGLAAQKWLWAPGFKTTFGSRIEDLVDQIGNLDSIFEKIRLLIYSLPSWMMPEGFKRKQHDHYMLLANPANSNTIVGEGGDNMGRGGRSSLYFLDEFAFVARAERVDAATSGNSDCRIFGSTVNGPGNLFARKRHDGSLRPDQVFRFHWTDDPRKNNPEWEAAQRKKMEEAAFASEYDIDYSASVEGICIPAKWVEAAQRIGPLLAERGIIVEPAATGVTGLDVGGGGKGKSVAVSRFGPIVTAPLSWGDPDTIETAYRGLDYAEQTLVHRSTGEECRVTLLNFDNIGIGHNVSNTLSHHNKPRLLSAGINVGLPASDRVWPDGETSVEKFTNLKAEAWHLMRERFKSTFEMLLFLTGKNGGHEHPPSDLIILPPASAGPDATALAAQISLPKRGRNEKGKMQIESKEKLRDRGIASPDHAEALVLTFCGENLIEMWERLAG
jgi:phage terminase large subunit